MIEVHESKEALFDYACKMIASGICSNTTDPYELTEMLCKIIEEKELKDEISDSSLEFNDTIISIEPMGNLETIDIATTGDNLFYCSDILTKNSLGGPMTADLLFAMVETEELSNLGQKLVIQLKNRYNDLNNPKKFVIGVDKARMKFFDVEHIAQNVDQGPVFDKTPAGKGGFADFA